MLDKLAWDIWPAVRAALNVFRLIRRLPFSLLELEMTCPELFYGELVMAAK